MSNYCDDCAFQIGKTVVVILKKNKSDFCQLGYTQTPRDLEATLNARKNGAEICERNPWKNY